MHTLPITIARHTGSLTVHPIAPPPAPPTLPLSLLAQNPDILRRHSPLYRMLCMYHPADAVDSILAAMHVTYSTYKGGSAVFYQIDTTGRIRNGHVVPIDQYGLRSHTLTSTWVHHLHDAPEGFVFRPCLFGEHLISRHRRASVAIVETEEEALIANIRHYDTLDRTVHVATAIAPDSLARAHSALTALRGREVQLLPTPANVCPMLVLAGATAPLARRVTVRIPGHNATIALAA